MLKLILNLRLSWNSRLLLLILMGFQQRIYIMGCNIILSWF